MIVADEDRSVWIWALLSDLLRTRWTLIIAQGKPDLPAQSFNFLLTIRSPDRPYPLHHNVDLDLSPGLNTHLRGLRQLLHQLHRTRHRTTHFRVAI